MITRNALATALTALAVSTAALAAPAHAGSVSFNLQPRNADEHRVMRAGLGIYALVNAVQSGSIRQIGSGNSAGLAQNGNGNSYGLFQFGRNTSSNVTQNGNGGTGATFQFGW